MQESLDSHRDASPLITFNLINQGIRTKSELKYALTGWRSVIAVLLTVGAGTVFKLEILRPFQ